MQGLMESPQRQLMLMGWGQCVLRRVLALHFEKKGGV